MSTTQKANRAQNAMVDIGQIEPEMQPRKGKYPMPMFSTGLWKLLEPVLTQAFFSQPLLGNIIITPEQREQLHTNATNILMSVHRTDYLTDYGLSDFQCDILVLNTVLLLRNWNEDDNASRDSEGFWEFICNQYALYYDEVGFSGSNEYKAFRQAIKKSLTRHKRLFLRTGHKFYTSLLVHAISPNRMFFALLDQIFAFYAKSLHYQWYKSDPAFRAFSYAMKDRFEGGRTRKDDNVYIKSVQSSSAIKALFTHCPEYMIDFVSKTVFDMDALLATGSIHEATYLDTLLLNWYEQRSREERTTAKRERLNASTERVVTAFSSIRAVYHCDADNISIIVPSIRLGEKLDSEPMITVFRYQDDTTPYSDKLRYYGDYFCITSSKTVVPIEILLSENTERIEPRIVISHADKEIYDSGSKLYRDAIVFNDDGMEISKRPNEEYINLFTALGGSVQGEDTALDCNVSKLRGGYMYRILVDDNTILRVNGKSLFPVEQVVSDLTINLSVAPVSHCKYLTYQRECALFRSPPTLGISSDIPSVEKRYRIILDDTNHPLAGYQDDCHNRFCISLPSTIGVHELRLVENTTQHSIYSLTYMVIEGFSLSFDGFYYHEGFIENGYVAITDVDGRNYYPYEMQIGQQAMLVPYAQGDLSIDVPTLRCRLNGNLLSTDMEQVLWFEDIPMFARLEVDAPRGYTFSVVIGQRTFSSSGVEIGNEIRIRHDDCIETVSVIIQKGSESPLQINLFSIAFEPTFKSPPLLLESEELLWCVENNYIGDAKLEFDIRITHRSREVQKYSFRTANEIVQLNRPFENGIYDYTIYYKSTGFFAEYKKLATYQLWVGDRDVLRFDDHAVIVTEAIIDDERYKLKPTQGIITRLRYIGELALNGETLHYPCYEGILQYKFEGKLRPYATQAYERNGVFREQVNPVKLWFINDFIISLRDPMNDGLYVKKNWESITDRVPSRTVSGRATESNFCNPDYYSYKVIPMLEVENV